MKKSKDFALFIKKKYRVMFAISFLSNGFVYLSELIDSILGGRFISEDAVSAIGLVQPFYMFIIFVGGLISTGTDTLYSRAAGNFDQKKANAIFGQSFGVTLLLSVIITSVMVIFKEPLLSMYAEGNSENIMALAGEYYDFYCFVAFFYPIYWLLYSIVFTDGGSKIAAAGDVANMLVNFVVSYILVGKMGIRGLGLGTFCGLLTAIAVLCSHFFTKGSSVGLGFQFKPKEIFETIALGLSSSTSGLMGAVVDFVMNIFIIKYVGYKFLPAYAIANMILNMGLVFSHAGTASNPLTSIYYGEKNPDGNKKLMYIVTKYTFVEAAVFTILLEAFAGVLPAIYGITDPEVFSSAVLAIRLLGLAIIPTALMLIYMMYYSTVGHNGLSMILLTNYMLVLPLVLCLPLGKLLGMNGIIIALTLTPVLTDLICIVVIFAKYGKEKFPLVQMNTRAKIMSWDIRINEENTMDLCNKVCTALEDTWDIDNRNITRIRLSLEETYMLIMEKNKGKKVVSECTIMTDNDKVEVIIRDNGMINDLSSDDEKPESLRDYVFKRISGPIFSNSYLKTASYNRNKYVFPRN